MAILLQELFLASIALKTHEMTGSFQMLKQSLRGRKLLAYTALKKTSAGSLTLRKVIFGFVVFKD